MKKRFIPEITYLRGLAMLGVVAIHIGSFAISYPYVNLQLVGILEIASRFSIPTFFFLSAFGLFYKQTIYDDFSYKEFLKRRFSVIAIPYLTWSLFYLLYGAITSNNFACFNPKYLLPTLFFGTACYQLYFIIIIIWFYLLMPLWRFIVRKIIDKPFLYMSILFVLQVIFNYYSSYKIGSINFDNDVIQYMVDMRLNYWVLHYTWFWLLGALFAHNYDAVIIWIHERALLVTLTFLASLTLMLGSFYYVIFNWDYSILSAIYTIHQLSPMGNIYTAATIPFTLYLFSKTPWSDEFRVIWQELGKTSFGIYLVHPFILIWTSHYITKFNWQYTTLLTINLYIVVLISAVAITKFLQSSPKLIRKLALGR